MLSKRFRQRKRFKERDNESLLDIEKNDYMSDSSISVIMPTINRGSLESAIKSVHEQLSPEDQLIVVGDGPCPDAYSICDKYKKTKYFEIPKFGHWGAACRDFGIKMAEKAFIWFLDDDDTALEGAVDAIKSSIIPGTDKMYFFKMRNPDIWKEKNLVVGNISSQTVVVPNRENLPKWGLEYAGDFTFAKECSKFLEVVWVDKLVAHRNRFIG